MASKANQTTPGKGFPFALLAFGGYAVALLFLLGHHEVWRDEVRAYSLARAARNPVELICSTLNNDGHPGLWHLFLWAGGQVTDNPVILKIACYLMALGFSGLFFFCSPFPLLHRVLFLVGFYPLHVYGVISRNYGIAVLLMFLLAREYTCAGRRHPWRAGLYNGLLANTNVYAAMCAVAFLFVPWQAGSERWKRRLPARWVVVLLTAAGLALSAYTVWPRPGNLALDHTPHGPGNALNVSLGATAAKALAVVGDTDLWTGFLLTGYSWKARVDRTLPGVGATLLAPVMLWGLLALLLRWPWLTAAYGAAFLAAGLFSQQVYPADVRHMGMLAAFLLTLLWIAWARQTPAERERSQVFLWLLGLCLLAHAAVGLRATLHSLRQPFSQSKNAGTFLKARYPTAVLVGEPDYTLEALRYYVTNPIFLVREQQYRDYAFFTSPVNRRPVTLTDLMAGAQRLKAETGKPVLLTLAVPIETLAPGAHQGAYGRTLSASPEEIEQFRREFTQVAAFPERGEETFVFYKRRASD